MSLFEVLLDATARPAFADRNTLGAEEILSVGAALELALAAVAEGREGRPFELSDVRILGPMGLERIAALRCVVSGTRVELSCMLVDAGRCVQAEAPFLAARIVEPGEPRDEASGIETDVAPDPASDAYVADPALLDAALQLLQLGASSEQRRVATAIERVAIFGRPASARRLRSSSPGEATATLSARDEAGGLVFAMYGVRSVEGPTLARLRAASLQLHVERLLPTVIADRAIDPTLDLVRQGVTSLELVRLSSALRAELGCELTPGRIAQDPRIEAIAAACAEALPWAPLETGPAPQPERAARFLPSYAQEQVWYLEELGGLGPTYHEGVAVLVHGVVDGAVMRRAFELVVQRHSALRACFAGGPQGPARATTQHPVPFEVRESPAGETLATGLQPAASERARAFLRRPFDLANGPLLRAQLAVGAERSLLVLAAHHILVDGWSLAQVVLPELAASYTALIRGQEPQLEPPSELDAFVRWQRGQVARISADGAELEWWKQALSEMPNVLTLPLDARRTAEPGYAGGRVAHDLSAADVAAVHQLSVSLGVTPFAVYLAAFALLLGSYGRQSRLTLGMVSANRQRREHERTVGMLANLLPVGLELDWNASVASLLEDVSRRVYGALDHQTLPFSRLVSGLARPRVEGAHPLVQAAIGFEEPWPSLAFDAAPATYFAVPTDTTKFDLNLVLRMQLDGQGERSAVATFEFRSELFDQGTMLGLAETWSELLASLVAKPQARLHELALTASGRSDALLAEIHGPSSAAASDVPVHEAIERWARVSPDAVALRDAQGNLAFTYRELNARADRIADWLAGQGVCAGTRVGVRLARTPDVVAVLLGILKAGAAYVPLDRAQPRARVLRMIEDAQVTRVLCEPDDPDELPGMIRGLAVPALAAPCGERARVAGDSLAYILFTSGSTGTPKGVMVEHRNLISFLDTFDAVVDPGARSSWLAAIALSFDFFVIDLLWPLSRGQAVVLHPGWSSGVDLDPELGVSHLMCTPSVLGWLLDQPGGRATLARLTHLLVGGEALTTSLVERVRGLSSARITNVYGPTEATVACTTHEVEAASEPVPIGRPLGNVVLRVVDPHDRPLPRGAHGELLIGGAGVARGYTGGEAPAQARFFEAPDARGRLQRWYRSGDLVRVRADGTFEFLGRVDRQIKLHGQRIEPAEIETAIRSCPAVVDCAVEVRDIGGEPRLVAHVHARRQCTALELHEWLRPRLPQVMIPSRWVWLPMLPRTASGKLDRAQLGDLPLDAGAADSPASEAGTLLERQIAELLGQAAGGPALGLDDDFFVMGGDSLAALRALSALDTQLGVHIPLRTLVAERTARGIARRVGRKSVGQGERAAATQPTTSSSRCRQAPASELLTEACDAYALATRPADAAGRRLTRAFGAHTTSGPQALLKTPWGPVAVRVLPFTDAELFADLPRCVALVRDEVAARHAQGARAIAFTGLLAAATGHGQRLSDWAATGTITTGHAATCAAVLTTLRSLLHGTTRRAAQERIAVLGVGSIGAATARLLCRTLEAPRELLLCDVPARQARVEALAEELAAHLPDTRIAVAFDTRAADAPVYEASVILGATSQAEVLDVARLRPGTLLVDDSAPHCVSVLDAIRRMRTQGDVIVCEAGSVRAPAEIGCLVAAHPDLDATSLADIDAMFGLDPHEIMACTLAARLVLLDRGLPVTVGEPTTDSCFAYLQAFDELGIGPAPLRLGGYEITDELLAALARDYGSKEQGA